MWSWCNFEYTHYISVAPISLRQLQWEFILIPFCLFEWRTIRTWHTNINTTKKIRLKLTRYDHLHQLHFIHLFLFPLFFFFNFLQRINSHIPASLYLRYQHSTTFQITDISTADDFSFSFNAVCKHLKLNQQRMQRKDKQFS